MISEILISLICLIAILKGIFSIRKSNFTGIVLLWIIFWFSIIVLINIPFINHFLKDFDIIISVIILFVGVFVHFQFKIYTKKPEKELTRLVRELALRESRK